MIPSKIKIDTLGHTHYGHTMDTLGNNGLNYKKSCLSSNYYEDLVAIYSNEEKNLGHCVIFIKKINSFLNPEFILNLCFPDSLGVYCFRSQHLIFV